MAQWLNWGDGSDGSPNAISGTVNTYATCTGTAGQTVLTTTLSASAGDQILIHQSQGTGAGTWEICKVVSDAGATLNLSTALVNSYGTGAQAVLIPQYTGGNISGAVTGTAWNGSVGGIIALLSNGDLTVSGSITSQDGFRGCPYPGVNGGGGVPGKSGGYGENYSSNYGGGGVNDGGATSPVANGGGGSAAQSNPRGLNEASGGGGNGTSGGNGGGGNGGVGGSTAGNESLTSMVFGGGSGAVGGFSEVIGNNGSKGGGIILIIAKNLIISGSINLNGTNGALTGGSYGGGAGGGAGGSCLIKCQTASLGTNKITATGGSGATRNGQTGGAGGAGRIRCDYFTSVSGSTTPTLSSAQDLTLNIAGGSGFFNFF